jgi:hypothetical protein
MVTPAACPLDSRHSETEVFIKRVAVMFTGLCLLLHLNSLQGMKSLQRLPMCIFLFIFNPVYPLLTLLSDIGWTILKAQTDVCQCYTIIGVPGRAGPPESYIVAAIGMHASHDEKHFTDVIEKTSTSLLCLLLSVTQVEKMNDMLETRDQSCPILLKTPSVAP